MINHAWILQERIQVAPFNGCRQQAIERVGGQQHEEQKADHDQAHDSEHAGDHFLREIAAENRHRERPARQHQHPEQQRAFMRAPGRGDAVIDR